MSKRFQIAAVACAFLVSGCTDGTPASSISAAIEVVIADQTLRASASLYEGSEPYPLGPTEHLTVGVNHQTIELTYDHNNEIYYGRPYYGTGALTQPIAADEPVTLTLERAEGTGSIVGTAPMALALQAPATVASGADLLLEWSPTSSDRIKWYARELNGISSAQGTIDEDVGTFTLPHDVIATLCPPGSMLELELQRIRSADVEGISAIDSGTVTVRRFESVEILVTE